MEQFFMSFKEFGLAGLLSGAGTLLLFFVIKWVLRIMEKQLDRMDKQQEIFNNMQVEWINALNAHTDQAKVFHDEMQRAHEYQRQEHGKIMDIIVKCQK